MSHICPFTSISAATILVNPGHYLTFGLLLTSSSEKTMAPHSSTLAWKIPQMEEPGGLPSMGSYRVGHDWSDLAAAAAVVKNLPASTGDVRDVGSISGSGRSPGGGHGNPLQCSCLENPMDTGAWWPAVHRVAQAWTQLKRLRTHSVYWNAFLRCNLVFGIQTDCTFFYPLCYGLFPLGCTFWI